MQHDITNINEWLSVMAAKLADKLGVGRESNFEFPFISFPAWAEVSIIFPFAGAAARFIIRRKGETDWVSVYLDTKEELGYWNGQPYWEAYPIGGDTARFGLTDTEGLIKAIKKQLRKPRKSS